MTAPGSASFVTSRENTRGIYTDFAPPNLLLSVLGISVGTLVKQVDHQIPVDRARPLASDFNPPNLLTGTFVKPPAPFIPAPTADNALHLWARWNATDFAPPNLLGRFLGPPPLRPVDTMGDAWSAGKTSFRGVYSDFIAPNVVLTLPPPRVGPYVPVETGVEITRRNVYRDFTAPNILLNSIALIGAGNSFPGKSLDGWCPRPWAATDFAPPNFQTTVLQTKPPFVPPEYLGLPLPARSAATDFQVPNFLTSTATLFFGNPPKVSADPIGYAVRPRGIYDDSPPQNFLTGPSSLVISAPLSAQDDGANAFRAKSLPTDFIPPNLITGILIPAAPPQPPAPVTTPIPGLQLLPYTFPDAPTAYRRISEVVNRLIQGKGGAAGTYNPTFKSGQVQYSGLSGQLAGSNDLIFGEFLPNPGGTSGPALLAGSGGGGGSNVSFWFITDQAFDTLSPGNDIWHTAGETQPGSSARGGNWTLIAGASDKGPGGQALIQGGTSVTGPPGLTVIQGGNNTAGNLPAGDVFIIAGQEGSAGATVHLIATIINGLAGVIRHRGNSTIRWDENVGDGSWFFYDGSGFGSSGAPVISHGPGQPVGFATTLANGTFSNGSQTLHIVNGLIQSISTP